MVAIVQLQGAVMMQQSLNKLTGQVEWNVVRLCDDG